VEPAEGPQPAGPRAPDFRGRTLRDALLTARDAGLDVTVDGWGRVVDQTPAPGAPVTGGRVTLVLSPATEQSLMAREPSSGAQSGAAHTEGDEDGAR
jgi:beta-lactam-binding protein with PASTA domain